MATQAHDPNHNGHDLATGPTFDNYPWRDDVHQEQALNNLRNTNFTTDQFGSMIRKLHLLDSERDSTSDQAVQQRDNDLADFIMAMYSEPAAQKSSFNADSIHADHISILNGVTSQHWLNTLKNWEAETGPDTPDSFQPFSKCYGNEHHNKFIIEIKYSASTQTSPPEVITLTAYLASTFHSPAYPGFAVGAAIVHWPG